MGTFVRRNGKTSTPPLRSFAPVETGDLGCRPLDNKVGTRETRFRPVEGGRIRRRDLPGVERRSEKTEVSREIEDGRSETSVRRNVTSLGG